MTERKLIGIILLCLMVFAVLMYVVVDTMHARVEYVPARVVECVYTPRSTSTSVHTDAEGHVYPVTHTVRARYVVLVEADCGVHSIEVGKTEYAHYATGQEITIRCKRGRLVHFHSLVDGETSDE